jgi:hypothetical protein
MAVDHLSSLRCCLYLGPEALVIFTRKFRPDDGLPGSGRNNIPQRIPMTYPVAMRLLVKLDPSGVRQLPLTLLPWICIGHVSVLGLIYGGTAAWLSRDLLQGRRLFQLTLAGVPVAFLMHAGAALFLWVFLKALGGKASFLSAYFLMGVAAISLWIFAPFLAMIQVRPPSTILLGAFVLTGVYGLAATARTIQQAFALSNTRMTIALSAAVTYIGCFLYLWM